MRPNKSFSLLILSLVFILVFSDAKAQSLEDLNSRRNKTVKTGMMVLGSWALLNLATAPIGAANTKGSTSYFYQMNGYWNIVNLGLAGFSYYSASKGDVSGLGLSESITESNSLQKLLLFNAGLDLAYMAGGFYLMERSKNVQKRKEMLKGFGKSLILQGAFLFVFDLGFYAILNHQHKGFENFLTHIRLSPEGLGFAYIF